MRTLILSEENHAVSINALRAMGRLMVDRFTAIGCNVTFRIETSYRYDLLIIRVNGFEAKLAEIEPELRGTDCNVYKLHRGHQRLNELYSEFGGRSHTTADRIAAAVGAYLAA